MAGDADEKAGRHRNGQKIGDEAELERAGANEDEPDREAERRRGRGVMGRSRRGEHRQRAGENRRDGRIRADRKTPAVAEERKADRAGDEREQADLRREVGETRGRHLRGNGDRGQRQAGDDVGAEVARTPAGERPQDRPGTAGGRARRSLCLAASPHARLQPPKRCRSSCGRRPPSRAKPRRIVSSEPISAARSDPLGGQAGVGEELTGRLDAQPLARARGRQAVASR